MAMDESQDLGAVFILCFVIALLCLLARITSRHISGVGLQADDYSYILGVIVAEGSFVVLMIYAYQAGLGAHWDTLSPDQILLFSKLNYAYNILNVFCYPPIKISILFLYKRIFITPTVRKVVWACVALFTGIWISTTLVAVFACRPIQAFYDFSIQGTCIDSVKFYWASATLNVITDLIVLTLPMPLVWKLRIPTKRKIGISLIFIAGGITFIASIIRIVYYLRYDPADPSYSYIGDAYATVAEVTLAIVCACAPTWRPLYRSTIDTLRSRSSGLFSSNKSNKRLYYHMDQEKGTVTQAPSDRDRRSDEQQILSDIEMPSLPNSRDPRAAYIAPFDGVYVAKEDGMPENQTRVYSERGRIDSDDAMESRNPLPLQGIRVKQEVQVDSASQ